MERAFLLAWKTVTKACDDFFTYLPNFILGIVIYLVFASLARLCRGLVMRVCRHANLDTTLCHALAVLTSTAINVLGLLAVATVIVPGFQMSHVVAGLGITSVVIGFAFKDILQNFISGLLLLWQKPFKIGDLIRSGDFEGIVEDVNIRTTHLRTEVGELILVPNGNIFVNPVIVRTESKIKKSFLTVNADPTRPVEENRQLIKDIISATPGVLKAKIPQVFLTDISSSTQSFKILFWTKSDQDNILQVSDLLNSRLRESLFAAATK